MNILYKNGVRGSLSPHSYFIAVFILASVLFGAFAYTLYKQADDWDNYNDWTVHSYEVLRLTRLTISGVIDMESGARGYMLTRSKEFLQPYYAGKKNIELTFDKLRAAVVDNPQHQQIVEKIHANVEKEEALLAAQVARIDAKRDAVVTVRELHEAKELMDEIRAQLDQFVHNERELLAERVTASRHQQKKYYNALLAGAAISIGGLLLATLIIIGLMTSSRAIESQLERAREDYRLLLENLNDGIYDYTLESGALTYSSSYARMLGYKPGEIEGTIEAVTKLIHPDDQAIVSEALAAYIRRTTQHFSAVFRLHHKNGGWRWVLSRGVGTWDANGKLVRILGVNTDVTEQKEHEEELRQLNSDLENFIYITSHDLRAPLVNLRGFAGEIEYTFKEILPLLRDSSLGMEAGQAKIVRQAMEEDIPEALGFIRAGVERMDMLTTAILDLSRIGRREITRELVDVNAIVRRCLDVLAYEIQNKDIQIVCEMMPETVTDAVALEQIFGNILDNAIKYLDPARPGVITIRAKTLLWETQFSVQDNGRGIAESDYRRVFDIFRRAGNSSGVRGSGMGMAFVKASLRRLGGKIWFESVLNQGTTFYFSIPAQPAVHHTNMEHA